MANFVHVTCLGVIHRVIGTLRTDKLEPFRCAPAANHLQSSALGKLDRRRANRPAGAVYETVSPACARRVRTTHSEPWSRTRQRVAACAKLTRSGRNSTSDALRFTFSA